MGRRIQDDAIANEAAGWVVWLRMPDAAKCGVQLSEWLCRSPAHKEAFLAALQAYRRLDGLRELSPSEAERWLEGARLPDNKVVPFPTPHISPRHTHRLRLARCSRVIVRSAGAAAIFLLIALVAAGVWTMHRSVRTDQYATAVGERQTIPLDDGTILQLNTHSRVRVTYSRVARSIDLLAGEIAIEVGKDSRPMRVYSGGICIEDIGTRFNVRRVQEATEIIVASGVIRVTYQPQPHGHRWSQAVTAELSTGESVAIGPEPVEHPPEVRLLSAADQASRMSWTQGWLRFEGETLAAIVEEFNRYHVRQIEIADPGIREFRLGGSFVSGDQAEFVRALQHMGIAALPDDAQSGPDAPIRLVRADR